MNLTLTLHGLPVTLICSCLGDEDTGGGLLYHDGTAWIAIDNVSTTGLYVSDNELTRMLWAPSQAASGTSILQYNSEGLARMVSIDGFTDPHDVLWDGHHYVAVSSHQNAVVWVDPQGTVVKRFQPAQEPDAWHLNSLLLHNDVLYGTAFGRFEQSRGWDGHQRDGSGMLFRMDTGEDVLTGLCCPHTPRFESGQWIVCNSATSEIGVYTESGEIVRTVPLQDWARGVAITDRYVLVGQSVNRQLTREVRGASVAIVDRNTWTVAGNLQLPFREVYDLVLVSRSLLQGILRSDDARLMAARPAQIPVKCEGEG
jgi:uncharacterized protein (TIGR03032 family)